MANTLVILGSEFTLSIFVPPIILLTIELLFSTPHLQPLRGVFFFFGIPGENLIQTLND